MAQTIKIETIVKRVNKILREHDATESSKYISGMQDLMEWILMETGTYRGVHHLTTDEVPAGCKPGIRHAPTLEGQFDDVDANRVQYLLKIEDQQ